VGNVELDQAPDSQGEITVPARKLVDICKSLPDGSRLEFALDDQRLVIRSGRSRFTLSTLPAADFPNVDDSPGSTELQLRQADLKRLIDRTSFAMAQQDVRYYLNGMLWEVKAGHLRAVATDGHRLAMCTLQGDITADGLLQVILPRKGVIELSRLLMDEDGSVSVVIGSNHFRATAGAFQFTSKLVDGKFPDYERVLPRAATKVIYGDREELRHAFTRASILSNEKYRGVRMNLSAGSLRILANNPEQEEAEEEVPVDYQGELLEIGFNVSYLLDVLGVLTDRQIKMSLADANSSVLLEETEGGDSLYVVMPMRL
jgi:DNA polymerase III subunit beta